MQALTRYPAVLAGLERTQPSLPLPAGSLLLAEGCGWLPAARAKLYRRLAIAPLFHRALARTEPALVHAHFATGGRTALALARKLGVPLLVTLHGADVTVRGQRDTHRDAYQELGEQARLFLCVSDFIRRRAIEAGLPAAKCLVHYIGIDRYLFAPAVAAAQSPRSILFIGRLVDKKGCEYLLRAMHRVQQQLPDAALTILGDGPLRASLEALAATLALRCTFLGSRPSVEVRHALERTRVLCAPSVTAANGDSEGLPTVIAEAQAMGVPVVATSHAGIPEIVVDGLTGLLVPERDTEALAHALITLLSDPDLWQRASRAAQHRIAEHFDLRQQTSLLEQIYDRALAKA